MLTVTNVAQSHAVVSEINSAVTPHACGTRSVVLAAL